MSRQQADVEKMSVFEQIKAGLEDGLSHAADELNLRTTRLPSPAPTLSKTQVVRIRRRTGMSQAVFAQYLNVPKKTLQSWEQGARTPKAGEARLLQLVERAPREVLDLISAEESQN